ncbi:MAG: hypothetical protein PF517_16550 [Salinivirgaceae bacterium]|jgi:hypothetical protein|nr:hypothetical protein [Salinivirgaceae bacterium]
MKYFWIVLITITVFSNCKEDETYIWEDDDFAQKIEVGVHDFILDVASKRVYEYSQIALDLNQELRRTYSRVEPVSYFLYYDSVTVHENDNQILVNYNIQDQDSAFLYSKNKFTKGSTLKVTLWASWYYKDKEGSDYTNGDEMFFGIEKEEIQINVQNIQVLETLSSFKDAKYDNTIYFVPQFRIDYKPNEIFSHPRYGYNDKYKFELEYLLKRENGEELQLTEVVTDSLVYLTYEGSLELNSKYTCKVNANWFVKHMFDDWILCEDYVETIEKEFTTMPIIDLDLTNQNFDVTYPLYRQCNFLIDEYSKGYFRPSDRELVKYFSEQTFYVKFSDIESSDSITMNANYNNQLDVFEYDIPDDYLELEHIYSVSFFIDSNEKAVYNYHFRTSMYRSFEEKWIKEELLTEGGTWGVPGSTGIRINVWPVNERMDGYESIACGDVATQLPLIQFKSQIPEEWKETKQYQIYFVRNLIIDRDANDQKFGLPPIDAIQFCNTPFFLSDGHINGEPYEFIDFGHNWTWNVIGQMFQDYENNKSKAGIALDSFDDLNINFGVGGNAFEFPLIDISYVLPGINVATTTFENYEVR